MINHFVKKILPDQLKVSQTTSRKIIYFVIQTSRSTKVGHTQHPDLLM